MLPRLLYTLFLLAFANGNLSKQPNITNTTKETEDQNSNPSTFSYPSYKFAYGVEDFNTGDYKNQKEVRDGDVVKGEYTVAGSDGVIRTVIYNVDKKKGFRVVIKKHDLGQNLHSKSAPIAEIKGVPEVGNFQQYLEAVKFGSTGEIKEVPKGGKDFEQYLDTEKFAPTTEIKEIPKLAKYLGENLDNEKHRPTKTQKVVEEQPKPINLKPVNVVGNRDNLQEIPKFERGKSFKEHHLDTVEFAEGFPIKSEPKIVRPKHHLDHAQTSKIEKEENFVNLNQQKKVEDHSRHYYEEKPGKLEDQTLLESFIPNVPSSNQNVGKSYFSYNQEENYQPPAHFGKSKEKPGETTKTPKQQVLDYLHEEFEKSLKNVENFNIPSRETQGFQYLQEEQQGPKILGKSQLTYFADSSDKGNVGSTLNEGKDAPVEYYVTPIKSVPKHLEAYESNLNDDEGKKLVEGSRKTNGFTIGGNFKEGNNVNVKVQKNEEGPLSFERVPTIAKTLRYNKNKQNFPKQENIYNFDEYYYFPLYQNSEKSEDQAQPEATLDPIQKVLKYLNQEKYKSPTDVVKEGPFATHYDYYNLDQQNGQIEKYSVNQREKKVKTPTRSNYFENSSQNEDVDPKINEGKGVTVEYYVAPNVQTPKSGLKKSEDNAGDWYNKHEFQTFGPKPKNVNINQNKKPVDVKAGRGKNIDIPQIMEEILMDYNQHFAKTHDGVYFDQYSNNENKELTKPKVKKVGTVKKTEEPKIDYHIQRHFAQQMKSNAEKQSVKLEKERQNNLKLQQVNDQNKQNLRGNTYGMNQKDVGLNYRVVHKVPKGNRRHKNIVQENLKSDEDSRLETPNQGRMKYKKEKKSIPKKEGSLSDKSFSVQEEEFVDKYEKKLVGSSQNNHVENYQIWAGNSKGNSKLQSNETVKVNEGSHNFEQNLGTASEASKSRQNLKKQTSRLRKPVVESMENQNYPKEFIENQENYAKMYPKKIVKYVNGMQVSSENKSGNAKDVQNSKRKLTPAKNVTSAKAKESTNSGSKLMESIRISSQSPKHATSYITYHQEHRRQETPKYVHLPNYPVEMLAFIYPEEFPENPGKDKTAKAKSSGQSRTTFKREKSRQNQDGYNPAQSISRMLSNQNENLTEDEVMKYIKEFDNHYTDY